MDTHQHNEEHERQQFIQFIGRIYEDKDHSTTDRLAKAPGTPWNPSPDTFKILRVSTSNTLDDAEFENELEEKGLNLYSVPSFVRFHSGAYEAVIHQDAIPRFAALFAVENCPRPWEPSQAEIRVQGYWLARRKALVEYMNRARQCRSEAQEVYRTLVLSGCVEELIEASKL